MKYLVNKNACYIITHDEIDVQRLQDRGCMFFLTEHDMYRHASIACGLGMEDVRGAAIFIGTDDDFQEDVMGIEIMGEGADIITFIEYYDY